MEIKLNASKLKWKIKTKELVKNFFDFKWGSALTDLVEIEKDIEGLAFLLLFQTARKTTVDLLKRYGQKQLDENYHLVSENIVFENKLKIFFETEIAINKNFFINILQYSPQYLTDSFLLFKEYASILSIELPEVINNIYYMEYSNNLEKEYQDEKNLYKKLVEYFDNPISIVSKKYSYIFEYYITIKSHFTNPLQQNVDECKERLNDLYIEPNFLIYTNNIDKPNKEEKFINAKSNIHDFVNNYFLKDIKYEKIKKNYNLLFLLGQLGQGKTSFCYKVVYDYLESNLGLPNIPIFFAKIRELSAKEFINNPFEHLTEYFHDNIDFNNDEALLILDGLDEAYMSGGINNQDLKNLYDRLNKLKYTNNKIKIILTSRENYLTLNDACLDDSLILKLDTFSNKQVIEYKQKYLKFHPNNKFIKNLDKFIDNNSSKKFNHLNELVRQPVILYFIALSNIDVQKSNSRSEIYNKIFNSLAERSWDKQKGQLDFIKKDIKPEVYQRHLRDYIRSIAFAIYQSPNLYISLKNLVNLESTKSFISRCFEDEFSNDSNNYINVTKYLLISFYFQESNKSSEETAIEFFHNSLWEFLTAEYFWEKFKDLFLAKDRNDDYINVDLYTYFKFLDNLIGDKYFTGMVNSNLQEIILNEKAEELNVLIERSKKLFYKLSYNDYLLKYDREQSELTAIEKIESLFRLSLNFIYYPCRKTNRIITLNSNQTKFFVKKIPKGVISMYDDDYNYISFSWMDREFHLTSSNLNYVIYNGSISYTVFNNCEFNKILFADCYLHKIEFYNSKFIDTIFNDVKVYRSNLFSTKCSFKECSFIDVEFESEKDYNDFINNNSFEENFKPKITKKNKHFILNYKSKNYDKILEDINSKILEI